MIPRFILASCNRNRNDPAIGNTWESLRFEASGFSYATQAAAQTAADALAITMPNRCVMVFTPLTQVALPVLTTVLVQTTTYAPE